MKTIFQISKFKIGGARSRRTSVTFGFFLLAAFAVFQSSAGEMKITLPPETALFKFAPGSVLANSQCLPCHSAEYVFTQPPMLQAFWSTEIKKMREKFGAQIPEDQIVPLTKYLLENYGVTTKGSSSSAPTTETKSAPATAQPMTVEALATRYACLSCHKVEVKAIGPAFKDVRTKYLNDPAALDKICAQIHNGGSGKWGAAIMPPFAGGVTDREARLLAAWIMGQDAAPR